MNTSDTIVTVVMVDNGGSYNTVCDQIFADKLIAILESSPDVRVAFITYFDDDLWPQFRWNRCVCGANVTPKDSVMIGDILYCADHSGA